MKILVTGAGGRVGTELCKDLAKTYELVMIDKIPIANPLGTFIQGSIGDWETVKLAMQGVDAVVHLAIHNPAEAPNQPYYQYIQDDVNIGVKGTDMLLYAAKENKVKRFVYTSSLGVYSARYPGKNAFLTDSEETLSAEHYGTIKWLAEELCRHYALKQGLSTIVLRFNSVTFPKVWTEGKKDIEHGDYTCTRVHINDVVRACRLAIEREGVHWGRCLISGANPEKRFDTGTAAALIGYRARYGFEPGIMYKDGVPVEES